MMKFRAIGDRCQRLALILLAAALLLSLLSRPAEALGRFAGGGAHFNIGGHFNGMRPIGGGDFRQRFPNVHPFENHPLRPYRPLHPSYWPYPGPGYWAGAAAGAAAVAGAWVYALPPDCTSISVGGITYERCGSEWYRPHYTGTQIVYEVVTPPR